MTAAPASLSALLPKPGEPALSADDVLDRFVGWVTGQALELYPAQEEALLELLSGKHLVLATPTGSGKSLVATFLHFKAMAEGKRSFYTCPIKALVNEKFFALCQAFGPDNVGMFTGDASINREAPIVCCTAEILSNLCLRDARLFADYVVMDEFHYYADKERGVAWQVPLLTLESTTFLLMSATLGDMSVIKESLQRLSGREVAEVKSAVRPVPLDYAYVETPLHETVASLLDRGRAPVYLVNFTQRAAAEQAQNLMSVDFNTKEEKERIRQSLFDAKFDTPYGKEYQRFLRHGVGLHHAGLLPKYRLLVERLAQSGLLKVISGTDTLGMGVNIPIRTVLFTQLCKFDGEKVNLLSAREFRQISGRAGRKGFDTEGSVVVQAPEHVIENLALEKKKQAGKKVVKRLPPQKGYVHWDRQTFDRLCLKEPEPLESRFAVTHGLIINLLQSAEDERGGGYRRLLQLVDRSHSNDHMKRVHKKTAAVFFRSLRAAGIVELERRTPTMAAHVRVAPGLQRDFSLNQTLSLYLLDTLPKLDPQSENYALDVLTLVESILESPQVVLYAQLDRLKGEKVAELKARGVEYAERMEELDKLEHPKPNRDFIYGTFNLFAAKHPWVGQENIRPKSIARELFETCATFHSYVVDYGLQRSEGVLLRYLSDAYKTLVQSVPEALRTEQLEDVIAFLRAALERVDSSLLDEWERMRDPEAVRAPSAEAAAPEPRKPRDLAADPRAFAARVRADLHRLLKALAAKDYEEAAASLFPAGEWTAKSLEEAVAPYWADHQSIDVTPAARRPNNTTITAEEGRHWTARQRIIDPTGEADWMLDCTIDLSEPRDPALPLIGLRRIGT
jgi:superfamily II RNA helicase